MKKNILYLECASGISGDMTVAALLDLGADEQVLRNGLESLQVDGYKIEIGRVMKNGIDMCDFRVILDRDNDEDACHHQNYEHNHDRSHEHSHDHSHKHSHAHNHEHNHEHSHSHNHKHAELGIHIHNDMHSHSHVHEEHQEVDHVHTGSHVHNSPIHKSEHMHRNINDINLIINNSRISQTAKELAKKIFYIVAEAEAKAHNRDINNVHFHEVGAVDSIVDIIGAAICLDNLGIEETVLVSITEGCGTVKCQHGVLPVPVPAVLNIAQTHQLPMRFTTIPTELVTPTGAAIAAAIKTMDTLPPIFFINKQGYGAGKKDTGGFNALRAMLIEELPQSTKEDRSIKADGTIDKVWELSANIDDSTGEMLAFTMELLLQAGVLDVFYTPIYMKKNRPAYLINVLCSEDSIKTAEEIIFKNTTTIGIRRHERTRSKLKRTVISVDTPFGAVLVKVCEYQGDKYYYPEYESVKEASERSGDSFQAIYEYIRGLQLKLD